MFGKISKRFQILLLVMVLIMHVITVTTVSAEETWICPNCGEEAVKKFCPNCGTQRPAETWICPNCGEEGKGKFCEYCGQPRKEAEKGTICSSCGQPRIEAEDASASASAITAAAENTTTTTTTTAAAAAAADTAASTLVKDNSRSLVLYQTPQQLQEQDEYTGAGEAFPGEGAGAGMEDSQGSQEPDTRCSEEEYSEEENNEEENYIEENYEEEYSTACQLLPDGDTAGAYAAFSSMGEFADSAEQAKGIEDTYAAAVRAKKEGRYDDAVRFFSILGNYSDCEEQVLASCYAKAQTLQEQGNKAGAITAYTACGTYEDSAEKAEELKQAIVTQALENEEYDAVLEYLPQMKQTEAVRDIREKVYALAQNNYDNREYENAVLLYESLGHYELSVNKLLVARYAWANQLQENQRYAEAVEQFTLLEGVSDSVDRITECKYLYGKQCMEKEQYVEAWEVLNQVGEIYADTKTLLKDCEYGIAQQQLEAGSYEEAQNVFEALYGYKDSADRVKECKYARANVLLTEGFYKDAWDLYKEITGYSDADACARECAYQYAVAEAEEGEYHDAYTILQGMPGYKDSGERIREYQYEYGNQLLKQGDIREALKVLSKTTELPQTKELLYVIGRDFAAMNNPVSAIETLQMAGNHEKSRNLLEKLGKELEEKGNAVLAFTAYASTNDETNALRVSENLTLEELEKIPWWHMKEEDTIQECVSYWYASCRKQAGKYDEAYRVYNRLKGYRDVDSILENDGDIEAVAAATRAPYKKVGNYITYGHYEQDNNLENGKEAIEWQALDVQGENVLLLSRYGLDVKKYNEEKTDITWEASTLRKWLNGTFFREAFTEEEQEGILETEVDNSQEQGYRKWETNGGSNTLDRIFLLSYKETNQYMEVTWENEENIESRAAPTAYALAHGAWVYGDFRTADMKKSGWWWLRAPGSSGWRAAYVSIDGSLGASCVTCSTGIVRPAIWLNLESVIF